MRSPGSYVVRQFVFMKALPFVKNRFCFRGVLRLLSPLEGKLSRTLEMSQNVLQDVRRTCN